jgi:hypothetical protein
VKKIKMADKDLYLIRLLKEAGWFEGRKLDRSYIIKLIKEEGYDELPGVIDFLQEFINLKFIFRTGEMD